MSYPYEPGTRVLVSPKRGNSARRYEFVKREDGSWRGLMHYIVDDYDLVDGYRVVEVFGIAGVHHAIDERIGALVEEARRKFDDAIYRVRVATDVTAEDVWGLWRASQSGGTQDAWKALLYRRELERRGQIEPELLV